MASLANKSVEQMREAALAWRKADPAPLWFNRVLHDRVDELINEVERLRAANERLDGQLYVMSLDY